MKATYSDGEFCWLELATPSLAAAKRFYEEVFGWETESVSEDPSDPYYIASNTQGVVCGMFELDPEVIGSGGSGSWCPYVKTDNLRTTVGKASQNGANVLEEPFDILDKGRMAVFSDPTGAPLSLWEPGTHPGSTGGKAEPGMFCWFELVTPSPQNAGRFFTNLFNWQCDEEKNGDLDYRVLRQDGQAFASLMGLSKEFAHVEAHWLTYFQASDCQKTVDTAVKAGAKLLHPPTLLGSVGTFAVLKDPQKVPFGLLQPVT